MKIQENTFVSLQYTLKLDTGDVVDQSQEGAPLGFVCGQNQIIPGLEKEIIGMSVGETKKVVIDPADGYGEMNPELLQEIPRDQFPEDVELEADMAFETMTPHGPVRFRVEEVKDDAIVADFNHPLAGERLHFDVNVAEVREATEEDMAPADQGCGHDHEGCGGCGGHC